MYVTQKGSHDVEVPRHTNNARTTAKMKYTKKLLIFLSSLMLCVGVPCNSSNQNPAQVKAVTKKSLAAGGNHYPAGENKDWTISLSTEYQDKFDVKSIHKFTRRFTRRSTSGTYSYFVTTERKSPTPESPYISKLKRVCYAPGKSTVDEYSEILLECTGMNGIYNLVQAAHVGKPGLNLMKSLKIRPEDEVVFATFSKSQTNNSNEPTSDSAVCIYSLDAINGKFTEKIRNCFDNKENPVLNFVLNENKCVGTISTIEIDTECIRGVKNMSFDGNEHITSSPLSTFTALPTDIITARNENHTIIFIGTSHGDLKTLITNDTKSLIYLNADWNIEKNSPIYFDRQLSSDESIVFNKTIGIKKIDVPEIPCEIFKTYDSCLQSDIKLCGWCGLFNLCTKKCECNQSQNNGVWLDYDIRKTTKITYISSASFERTSDEIIEMTIENLPSIKQFNCSIEIGNEIYTTPLSLHQSTAFCTTPSASAISTIPLDYDHLNATLRIETNYIPNIASINITFFDCRMYNSCDKCVSLSTKLKCNWYIGSGTCRPGYQTTWGNILNESVVTSNNSNCPTVSTSLKLKVDTRSCNECNTYDECLSCYLPDCGWCTTANKCILKNECSDATELTWINYKIQQFFSIYIDQTNFSISTLYHKYLRNGRSKPLQVSLNVSFFDILKYEIYCKITFETLNSFFITNTTVSKKTNTNYTIVCETPIINRISVPSFNHFIKASLIIELANITEIYKTPILFFDCNSYNSHETCVSSNFDCQWCPNERICTFNATNPCKINTKMCLNSLPPLISSIKPVEGPCKGGTNLTIFGENLGCIFEDTSHSSIKVAGIPCIPLKENYVPAKMIVCNINGSSLPENLEGPVELWLNESRFKSQQKFKFVNSKITDFFPKQGFIYGGTELTFKGEHLDAGRYVEISVGNASCPLIYRSANEMKCITSPSAVTKEGEIIVKFDKNICKPNNSSYKFIKDAERDENGYNTAPKGILSGGVEILIRNITFTSTTSIRELQFLVHINNTIYNSSCLVQNNFTATCPSPRIPDIDHSSFTAQNPLDLEFSLKHQTENVWIINTSNNSIKFTLYPDPDFFYFLNSSLEFNDRTYVIIKGRYINLACQKSDIKVKVGNDTCTVISLSSNQVVCSLPKSQSVDFNGDFNEEYDILTELENITVLIGDQFKQIVPKQQEFSAVKINKQSENFILPIIIISMAIFVILIISSVIAGQKIRAKASQKIKDTQLQMDKLQLCVASECKEAFAELQTEMSTFTSQNQCNGLPFLDYRSYVTNILFPDVQSHSFIFYGKAILIHKEQGLQLFSNLIKNRRFLLTFVRTLESNESFSIKDRVFVASMIMTALQNDMEYCTDILKSLMAELIQKCIQGKSHPKLLFRRSESVAEKMLSAWFAFLLYKFLRETAANPLINLFSAIKQQVSKGPVDMITSDARYCLSENKMIRQKIDYTAMTMFVTISEKTAPIIKLKSAMKKVQVKVLDCDAISQVKEKIMDIIYNTNHCSQRPDPSEICIEWLTGSSKGIILTDTDHTSEIEGELRQINTLRHYGVTEGSTLNLISFAETNYRTSDAQLSDIMNFQKDFSSLKKKRLLSESATPLIQNDDAHCKDWHLIKPIDLNSGQEDHTESNQIVPEIYLTRLLGVKNSLQSFVNDLFATILKKNHQKKCFPTAIKYMFDFLDDQALQHGITDPEVVHVWKNNCLPLRFWVNLIKNPNFLFDIHKSATIDSCLSVIAQVLMDSCSTTELNLNKDSATSKLLYAKEISFYRKWVHKYYSDIKSMPAISPQCMSEMLLKESQTHATDFDSNSSADELLKYALKYKEKLIDALKADKVAQEDLLALKLEKVYDAMPAVANV
ncbi:plexin-A4-like isoform X1 [Planococcus citri]|uniref:plexin-A4-like isoform X1 n=1 Tax=Planococcus citri TaxID=170843 RepID=UPI0031F74B56